MYDFMEPIKLFDKHTYIFRKCAVTIGHGKGVLMYMVK